ncbi:MAG: hypothetical protein QOH90_1621, partial [Actinomycetota bacterium]|nr:hypothetical protein [Actinomycetota bacterium]
MFCGNCGAENREGQRFCTSCGTEMAAKCPNCGAPVVPGDVFCGSCGTPVGAPAPVTRLGQHEQAPAPAPSLVAERRLVSVLFV